MDNRLIRRTCMQLTLCLVLLPAASRLCWCQTSATRFSLSCNATKEELLVGEPLFVKAVLRNQSVAPQTLRFLRNGDGIDSMHWRLAVAEPDGPFREIRLQRVSRLSEPPDVPASLAPGEKMTDVLAIWFAAHGDVPGERRLVFPTTGRYRYQITFTLVLGGENAAEEVSAVGEITVTGQPKGFSELVRGLRPIMQDNSSIAYRDRKQLDSLLADLEGSPYLVHAQWLRVRSLLLDGLDDDARDASARDAAATERKVMAQLADKLLASCSEDKCPVIIRDSLIAKGLLAALGRDKAEARRICDEVTQKFGMSDTIRKLRTWAY